MKTFLCIKKWKTQNELETKLLGSIATKKLKNGDKK